MITRVRSIFSYATKLNGLAKYSPIGSVTLCNVIKICTSEILRYNSFHAVVGIGSGQFTKISSCTCSGDTVAYLCNVTGSGFTIWRGSAFDCADSRILLRHSSFQASSGTMGLCNDGAIIGRSLGISSNSLNNPIYMSQLMVNLTASSNVIGQTVECVYRNINGMETTIGSATIEITGYKLHNLLILSYLLYESVHIILSKQIPFLHLPISS